MTRQSAEQSERFSRLDGSRVRNVPEYPCTARLHPIRLARRHAAVVMPGVDQHVAESLVRDTERLCPYTKMTRQGICSVITVSA